MDTSPLTAAFAAAQTLAGLVKRLADDQADVLANDHLIAIQSAVIDLQGKLLAAQAVENDLLAEIAGLKAKLRFNDYEPVQTPDGAFILRLKPAVAEAAGLPPHCICHVCAERGVLAYLHREDSSSADTHYHWYRCLTCGRSFADSTTPELGPV